MKFFKQLYIQAKFYWSALAIILLFVISYFYPVFFKLAYFVLLILIGLLVIDILLVFVGENRFQAERKTPERLSNGDENSISILARNQYPYPVQCTIIDEIPVQFQKRDFKINASFNVGETKEINYTLRPLERGEYLFGKLNIYVSSMLGLISKRYKFSQDHLIACYPSFIQLKQFELININRNSHEMGIKKIRRLGHSMEFEQIKDYVTGDDLRTINWKATAKKNTLMVNQFQDEKAQAVYCVIDKGRAMQMPFNGLSLLDYAINSTLVINNIVLKKGDKAGILSFSKNIKNFVVAERRTSQMNLLLDAIYKIKTDFFESDFNRLYSKIKRNITTRSLILLFTNFETLDGLNRQLPYLKAIAKNHLLIVVFFKNVELNSLIADKAETVQEVYDKVIAEKFAFEKRLIVQELKKYGIHSILTEPENLTINSINKYLEIKSRGLL